MESFPLRHRKIWVAGHTGLAGSAVVRRLRTEDCELLTVPRAALDLRRQADVEAWMAAQRPEIVVLAAATVGGIAANSECPADFLHDNLLIQTNVITAAHRFGVRKLLFLGSSCIYPRDAAQPMTEDALLTGALEPTNEAYAVAKIAGVQLCQGYRRQYGCDFISAMPCNLYGPGDTYDAQRSHAIPALILKLHEAKERGLSVTELWGTGRPLREFLHSDDAADAFVHLLKYYSADAPVNVGSGEEISIAILACHIAAATGYTGAIRFNPAHPDGAPRKLLDSSCLRALGWTPRIALADGLAGAYADYCGRDLRAAA